MVETLSEVSMRLHLLQRNLKCEMPYIFDRVHKLNLEEFSRKCKQLLCCLAFPNEASSDSKFTYEYQRAHAPDLIQLQDSIHDIQKHLNEELACIRSLLHLDTLEFVTMRYGQLTLDYVVEVPKANTDVIHRVPSHWCLVSSTKSLRRYQTPNVMAFCAQLDSAKASLHIATRRAWQEFLRKAVAEIASELDRLDYFLCEMDALLSLSRLASLPGYVRPQFHPPPVNADHEEFHSIHIMGGRHIIIDHLLTCSKTKVGMESSSIPNDVRLSRLGDVDPRSIVLSGPNMGGKSVYTSMIATIVILAQMGSFVPAERVDMCVVDAVLSANSNKHFSDIPRGLSSFAAELDRIKYVLSKASDRSLVIVDELGRGASVLDGSAVAVAVLEHLTTVTRCMSIFVTHFPLVSSHAVAPLSRCFHMDCLTIDASGDQKERIVFLFKLVPGAVPSSLGFHVARLAGLDEALIEKAVELSAKL
jgi:DNA mismatch repair protein MSH3